MSDAEQSSHRGFLKTRSKPTSSSRAHGVSCAWSRSSDDQESMENHLRSMSRLLVLGRWLRTPPTGWGGFDRAHGAGVHHPPNSGLGQESLERRLCVCSPSLGLALWWNLEVDPLLRSNYWKKTLNVPLLRGDLGIGQPSLWICSPRPNNRVQPRTRTKPLPRWLTAHAPTGPKNTISTTYKSFHSPFRHCQASVFLLPILVSLDVSMAINAVSDMLRQKGSPTRSRRKVVRKDRLLY